MIPKWDLRARVGIYLGHSPCHAGSVALVFNLKTLRISPQFHLVFDDKFATVPFMRNGEIPPHWEALVKSSTSLSTPEDFDLAKSWENQYIANDPVSVDEEDGATSGDSILLNAHSKKVPVSKEVLDSSNSAKIISRAVAMSQSKLLEMRTLWLIRMLGKLHQRIHCCSQQCLV